MLRVHFTLAACLLVLPISAVAEGLAGWPLPVRRDTRHPQLSGIRRRRRARLRHRPRAQVRQADRHAAQPRGEGPDNVKGVCASAATGRLYFTTPKKLYCLDLLTEKTLWEKCPPQGCDRMSMTPDGKVLYVPSFEKDIWNVVDGESGDVIATIEPKSGAHNTVVGLDGSRMYLAGLKSPLLTVADTKTHKIVGTVGPFAASIRPFTVNGKQTLVYVNVNECLGFEIGDLTTGKKLHRVEVEGYKKGPDQAAWLPEPWHRTDAGREGSLGRGRGQPAGPHLRQHGDAAEADGESSASGNNPDG